MNTVQSLKDIPIVPHFAIFSIRSIHIPGDERSKQYPGHGYPDSTEYAVNYKVISGEEELRKELNKIRNLDLIRVVQINPVAIQQQVSFTINGK